MQKLAKKETAPAKLVTPKPNTKTAEEIAYEEYVRQLELAIENH
jgi:hypothetical protein